MSEEKKNLTPEELENANGGINIQIIMTMMECPCGYATMWGGDYLGKTAECPSCNQETLKGVDIRVL